MFQRSSSGVQYFSDGSGSTTNLTKTHFKGWGHRGHPVAKTNQSARGDDGLVPVRYLGCHDVKLLTSFANKKLGGVKFRGHEDTILTIVVFIFYYRCCCLHLLVHYSGTLSVVVCQYDSNYVVFSPLST